MIGARRFRLGVALSLLPQVLIGGCTDGGGTVSEGAPWHLNEVWRIGTSGEEGTTLYSVSAAVWLDSILYVLETLTPRVACFDANGAWIGDFLTMGDGPGEVRSPWLIGTGDRQVWVGDPNGARLEVFSPEGESLQSIRFDIPPDSLGLRAFPLARLSNGSVLAGPSPSFSFAQITVGGANHGNYYRTTSGGDALDLVSQVPYPAGDFFKAPISENRQIVGQHPLPERPLVSVFPDGSGVVVVERWAAETGEKTTFNLKIWGPDGSLEFDTEIPYQPVPSGGWLEHAVDELRSLQETGPGGADEAGLAAYREAVGGRAFLPPVTAVILGSDGTIWLRREGTGEDSVKWEIRDRGGRFLGHLLTPSTLTILTASRTEIVSVEVDDLDVQRLVRYQIEMD